jgi:hypothetical protein
MCDEIPSVMAWVPPEFLQAISFPREEPGNLVANLHLSYLIFFILITLQYSR